MEKAGRTVLPLVISLVLIFFGFLIAQAGYSMIHREWHSIGSALAACAVAWILAGPVMFVAGWWVLGSWGRREIPLWLGGAAAIIAGTVLVAGVLTHVIPCSGPS